VQPRHEEKVDHVGRLEVFLPRANLTWVTASFKSF